jgi:hypothetical protein
MYSKEEMERITDEAQDLIPLLRAFLTGKDPIAAMASLSHVVAEVIRNLGSVEHIDHNIETFAKGVRETIYNSEWDDHGDEGVH